MGSSGIRFGQGCDDVAKMMLFGLEAGALLWRRDASLSANKVGITRRDSGRQMTKTLGAFILSSHGHLT